MLANRMAARSTWIQMTTSCSGFAGASSQAQTSIRRRPACESQDNTPEVKGIS
jgi:hypothetical protein